MGIHVNKEDEIGIKKIESFNRVTKGETIEPVVLDGKYLNSIRSQIQGIDIPLFNGVLQSIHIIPLPEEEFYCDIISIKSNFKITANFKRYRLKDKIVIILESDFYRLNWDFNLINGCILENNKSTININMKANKQSYEKEIYETQVLIDWLMIKKVKVYKQNDYKWTIPLPKVKRQEVNEFVSKLKMRNRILKNIINVRRYFGVNFKNINKISNDEAELLERLNQIGKTGRIKLEYICLKLKDISFSEGKDIDTFKKDGIFLLETKNSRIVEVQLFGEKITLGSSRIKCKDAYISNYDEVKDNNTDKLIIKSKREKLFVEYY